MGESQQGVVCWAPESGKWRSESSEYARNTHIAAGEQNFAFSGAVRTADEASPDVARIVAEYRDLHNHLVLEAFDSGEILSYEWHPVSDVRVAPAGAGIPAGPGRSLPEGAKRLCVDEA